MRRILLEPQKMHSQVINSTVFIHNSDFSGDVSIREVKDGRIIQEVSIPGDDLLEFISRMYKDANARALEKDVQLPLTSASFLEMLR